MPNNCKIKFLLVMLFTVFYVQLSSQVFLNNTQEIDYDRYGDYTGNPYYFENNQVAKVYVKGDEKAFELNDVNVNLLSESVEIFKGDKFIELDKNIIRKVDFEYEENLLSMIPDSTKPNGFLVTLFLSDRYSLFQSIHAITDERVYNTPGKTMVKQYIRKKEEFILEMDGKPHEVKIKKKEVLSILGKNAEKTLKKTKNKMKNQWDLLALLVALDNAE